MTRTRDWMGLALLALCATGCPVKPYLKATETFATATADGMKALSPANATAQTLCRRGAELDQIQKKITSDGKHWDATTPWPKWSDHRIAEDQPDTWGGHCESIAKADQALADATAVGLAYADALKRVASGGSYEGTDLKNAADNAGTIAEALKQDRVAGALRQLGDPLTALADLLIQEYSSSKLDKLLEKGGPAFMNLTAALARYVEAVEGELDVAESKKRLVQTAIEVALSQQPTLQPTNIIAFTEYCERLDQEFASDRQVIASYQTALANLTAANQELTRMATSTSRDDRIAGAKKVIGFASRARASLAAIQKGAEK